MKFAQHCKCNRAVKLFSFKFSIDQTMLKRAVRFPTCAMIRWLKCWCFSSISGLEKSRENRRLLTPMQEAKLSSQSKQGACCPLPSSQPDMAEVITKLKPRSDKANRGGCCSYRDDILRASRRRLMLAAPSLLWNDEIWQTRRHTGSHHTFK